MDFTYPEKYFKAALYFKNCIGDLESTTLLNDEQKLMFYALQKQAEEGPCTEAAPSFWNYKELYKHRAWHKLGNISKFEAMVYFVRQLEAILGGPVNWKEKMEEIQPQSTGITTSKSITGSSPANSLLNQLIPLSNWDKDLSEHAEPTARNIAFMASQVMHARRLCKQLNDKLTETSQAQKTLKETPTLLYERRLPEPETQQSSSQRGSKYHMVPNGGITPPLTLTSTNCSQRRTLPQLDHTKQCALVWLSWI
ncbi:unnamed protein product [Phytomonas sp. Hart1]|nr:unnamed protein product [Phytomonas sp. Hart1]|eukprot:CCW70072.1 unnamed protein product [Phytomonas sp. isolate Hart1]